METRCPICGSENLDFDNYEEDDDLLDICVYKQWDVICCNCGFKGSVMDRYSMTGRMWFDKDTHFIKEENPSED